MSIRVGINGFGRIGRNVVRAAKAAGITDIDFVAVNDLTDTTTLAHLLKYDSVHGRFPQEVTAVDGGLDVGGDLIRVFSERDPARLPWGELGVDIVLESTGIFTDRDKAALHLQGGAKKVIISAPAKGEDKTFVYGVNHLDYDPATHHVVSNASCTTNCLVPVVKVIRESFGFVRGFMTTVHVRSTSDTSAVGTRSAMPSIFPFTSGITSEVALAAPVLVGMIESAAARARRRSLCGRSRMFWSLV